jgi:hypothetical protein
MEHQPGAGGGAIDDEIADELLVIAPNLATALG